MHALEIEANHAVGRRGQGHGAQGPGRRDSGLELHGYPVAPLTLVQEDDLVADCDLCHVRGGVAHDLDLQLKIRRHAPAGGLVEEVRRSFERPDAAVVVHSKAIETTARDHAAQSRRLGREEGELAVRPDQIRGAHPAEAGERPAVNLGGGVVRRDPVDDRLDAVVDEVLPERSAAPKRLRLGAKERYPPFAHRQRPVFVGRLDL